MDWKKLKAEYIAGGTSYRKLAEKYDVSFSTLRKTAAKEKWSDLRNKARAESDTKIIDKVSDENAKNANLILVVANKLLGKLSKTIDKYDTIDSQSLKQFTSALKDLSSVKGFKSEADMREQEARIANLQRQVNPDDDDKKPSGVVLIPAVKGALDPPNEDSVEEEDNE